MKKLWQKTPAWITYTVLFTTLICVLVGCLFLTGRSMIWELDGMAQHYPILLQLRHMIVSFLKNPSGGFTHWAWNISLGSDQLTNLAYYVIGDPFNYLVVLFPKSQIENVFAFLVFLRMYFSGLAFMLFSSSYHFKKISRVIGAIAYAFSGYALATALHHPFFILPLIFYPLLCYGIDRVLHNKSWLPLIFAVFLVFLSNFYFAWILGLGSVAYVIIRMLSMWKRPNFEPLISFGKLIISAVIGLGMAAIVFIPTIILATGSTRITDNFANGMTLFPLQYYLDIPSAILPTGRAMNFWLVIGISGLSFLGLVYMLRHFKRYFWPNVALITMLVGILLPAVGAVMNAISTPSNRWVFLVTILFGFATMIFVDHIGSFTKNDVAWFAGASIGLITLVWVFGGFLMDLQPHDFVVYGFLLLTLIAVLGSLIFNWSQATKLTLISTIFLLNISANIIGIYSPHSSKLALQQLNRGLATRFSQDYFNGAQKYLDKLPGFFRVSMGPKYHYNTHIQNLANYSNTNTDFPINSGLNDTSVYLTLQNGYLGKFSQSVGNSQFSMNTPIAQGDYRTAFNNLLGVKYMFAKANTKNPPVMPYGYKPVRDKNGDIKVFPAKARTNAVQAIENMYGTTIYKSNDALPLIYTQSKTVSPTTYNQLSKVDRERVMTQGAVVNSTKENTHPLKYTSPSKNIGYQVKMDTSKIVYNGRQLTKYRLGIINKSNSDKLVDQPHEQVSLGANLQRTKDLLAANRSIIETNHYKNINGLREMTSDVTGNPIDYTLHVKQPKKTKNTELFLVLSGIQQQDGTPAQRRQWMANQFLLQNKLYSRMGKMDTYRQSILKPTFGGYMFSAFAKDYQNGYNQYDNNNLSNYRQIHSIVLNLGYSTHQRKNIDLKFNQVKNIKFKSAKLIAMPYGKSYDTQMQKLKATKPANLKVNGNHVSGTTSNVNSTTMVTSIPYSTGWKLTIDGQSAKTFVVNKGFVGANLPAGTHQIKLNYTTPGIKVGKLISAVSWLVFIILIGFGLFTRFIPKKAEPKHGHMKT
ncbi:YfhO family protein [Lentilactobacillus parabuchneri]|uniref:YfhO family protein n=1 Tax=Lentilactobacillus parabuchneri TaxID=152331 RepID=UPI000A0FAA66|nr:YfhO family protein [Lentilactobacillus parabuchneri]ORN04746.1 Bacterial membrane protein YfhO [Lentilactobacillus parabuchneri]